MLGFGMCSTGISRQNWKSAAEAGVARESTWLFSVLEICFEVAIREFGFSSHGDLQVRDHLIVFGCVVPFDLTHYEK